MILNALIRIIHILVTVVHIQTKARGPHSGHVLGVLTEWSRAKCSHTE